MTTPMPALWSARYWCARGFNGVMHIRNRLLSPSFMMYYLTFPLPELVALLDKHGFPVDVRHAVFAGRFRHVHWSLGRWLSGKQRDTSDVVLPSHVSPMRASSGSVAKSMFLSPNLTVCLLRSARMSSISRVAGDAGRPPAAPAVAAVQPIVGHSQQKIRS